MIRSVIYSFLFVAGTFSMLAIISCDRSDDDSTPVLSILPRNDFEGTGTNKVIDITLSLSAPAASPVTVACFAIDSTAKSGDDFLPITDSIMVFDPGETSKTINVEIISDSVLEFKEYFILAITTETLNVNISEPSLAIMIVDDDYIKPTEAVDGFITPDSYPGMNLTFAEEFNDSLFNSFYWRLETGAEGWAPGQLQEYTSNPENIALRNDKLMISAANNGGHYTSARITTQGKWAIKYGLVNIRAKLPRGKGIWPALWFLSADFDGSNWPACGEIDLVNLNGQAPGTIIGSAFYDLGGPRKKEGFYSLPDFGDSFSDQFHVFSILWQPDKIEWLVDDRKYLEIEKADIGQLWPFNNFFALYMNLAVGGTLVGEPDNTTVFPQTMEVDYIRAFVPVD